MDRKAVNKELRAARRARRAYKFDEAVACIERALDVVAAEVDAQASACPECGDTHSPIVDVSEDRVCRVCGTLR